ncbi:MAG: UDP-N-acetylmuramoyl-L-alanyl-D-glutamate--2,6-diaminopimelate ligase [Sediminibacterium sp.]|nr:UDP-N-acetylmuramoyl-L-alanyl-D-glutamate--2,6-diaminopimelate ligase [Sediminibacterium sp.]
MKLLHQLIEKIPYIHYIGDLNIPITEVVIDSRKIVTGCLFIALEGGLTDGHNFIEDAIKKGASAIVHSKKIIEYKNNISYIEVKDAHYSLAFIASAFYNNPSAKLKMVGVTGTNGKTTVATLLFKLFSELGYSCGLISTVQNQIKNTIIPATHTTPDALQLHGLLSKMVAENCQFVFMECSSHAIHQQRIIGINFIGAIFTNLTLDHLDYHKTFEEYMFVKKKLFDDLSSSSFSISNIDDTCGMKMIENTKSKKVTYSIENLSNIKGKLIENNLTGLVLEIDNVEIHFKLVGKFNAYNLLAVYGTAVLLGEDKHTILKVLSTLEGAAGRFDGLLSRNNIMGIIDYAHTPDALENVLNTIQQLKKENQQLITVVGCGGNRDKTKRPHMLQIACKYSDTVIVTADNPRFELPEDIISDMFAGIKSSLKRKTTTIIDRKLAIETAVKLAHVNDIILIAGKGHEKYQEINGVKNPFDDKKILSNYFNTISIN